MSQIDYNSVAVAWSIETLDSSFGVRTMGIMQEPEESEDINFDTMRHITGGDAIYARSPYGYDRPFTGSDPTLARSIFRSNRNITIPYDPNEVEVVFNMLIKPNVCSQINFICNEFELSEEDKNCCICMTDKNNEQICSLNCSHTFCVECIDILLKTKHNCPLFRTVITQIQTQTIEARQLIHH
jgi:hypothetical protein